MEEVILELSGISKSYAPLWGKIAKRAKLNFLQDKVKKKTIIAVDDLSLSVKKGEIFGSQWRR